MIGSVGGWPGVPTWLDGAVWTKGKEVLGATCLSLSLIVLCKMWLVVAAHPCYNINLLYIVE